MARTWVIPVSRRLSLADGEFSGLVTAMIDPAALWTGYAKSEAPDTAVGVVGLDGIYRSRLLGDKVSFGEKVDVALLEQRAREIQTLRRPVKSPIDGVQRFVATVRVARYPLVAVVAVNADTALAGYRHARSTILGWAAAVATLIVIGVLLLRGKIHELEKSRQQTRRAEAAFRATLEGSMDAVSIMQAQRNAEGQLVDLLITDSNGRAAALIGRTREEVIGQLLCSLTPSIRAEGFLAQFDKVIRTGRASSAEVRATDPNLAGRWLHHQVVPLEDGVALITRDVTERRETLSALAGLAHVDALTQLGNRRDFDKRLQEARARSLRSGQTLALLFLDLDGFKAINDSLGHAAGDELLVGVAKRLRDCVRLTDTVNRLGGDEFTIMLEGAGGERDICDLCERIVSSLSQAYEIGCNSVRCTPSIGVAILGKNETLGSLQQRADAAMYIAKRSGTARYRLADVPGRCESALVVPA